MLTYQTFASSSAGNASLLSWGEVHILIDFGISCRRVQKSLADRGLGFQDLSAVCVTHEHKDHIAGLAVYTRKMQTPILCSAGTARQLAYQLPGVEAVLSPFYCGDTLDWRGVSIRTFPLSHDASDAAGYRFDTPEGSMGILTDTGFVTGEARQVLSGVDLLVLEANHDVECLRAGPYPYPLKQRVLGPYGHLSNDAAAEFACLSAARGTGQILLAHLSAENNTPAMALHAVGRRLEASGYRGTLSAAPRADAGEIVTVRRGVCSALC